ncbi:TIGR01458 family HAD-type hydrolase [Thiogranum longum]
MRAILFDLDGVIYVGNEAIGGARDAVDWVRSHAIPHLFVTNTTSRPRAAICRKLKAMDISVDPEHILTPPVAAAHWLEANVHGPVALFVPEATQTEFKNLQLWDGSETQSVAAVVLGDLGEDWSFARLNQAFRCLMQKPTPKLIALGMTRYWRAADGLRLDTGPFVAALQYATGAEPLVIGKPANAFFHAGADALGADHDQVLMIGDDIRGDIEGARKAGLKAMLVRTGKFQPGDLQGNVQPDVVLDSIADLPRWWEDHAKM